MMRKREKLKRQRRPEFFLYFLKRRWHRRRSTAMVILSGRKDAGRMLHMRDRR